MDYWKQFRKELSECGVKKDQLEKMVNDAIEEIYGTDKESGVNDAPTT